MGNDLVEVGKSIFESKTFGQVKRYLKNIREAPTLSLVLRLGKKSSSIETEKCNNFNENFVSVVSKKTMDTPKGTPQQIKLIAIQVTSEAVCKFLDKLEENKAKGHDEIGNFVLRQ